MPRPTTRATGSTGSSLRRAAAVLAVGALSLVAACSGDEAEPLATSSASAEPSTGSGSEPTDPVEPTEEPTPEGVVDRSDDATGLQLVHLPELTGEEAAVVNAYTQFQTEYWHTRRTSTISPTAYDVLTPTALPALEGRITKQTEGGYVLGGTVTLAPRLEFVDGDLAAVSACVDETGVLAISGDVTEPALSGGGNPTHRGYADLVRESGTWKVSGYTIQTEECTP